MYLHQWGIWDLQEVLEVSLVETSSRRVLKACRITVSGMVPLLPTSLLHRTKSLTTLELFKKAKSLQRSEATMRMFRVYATSSEIIPKEGLERLKK